MDASLRNPSTDLGQVLPHLLAAVDADLEYVSQQRTCTLALGERLSNHKDID